MKAAGWVAIQFTFRRDMKKSIRVAEFIKTKRVEKKLSQAELSYLCGINVKTKKYQSLSNIERGLAQLPAKYIVKLAEALEVPCEKIVELMTEDYKELLVKNLNIKTTYNYPEIY